MIKGRRRIKQVRTVVNGGYEYLLADEIGDMVPPRQAQ